MGDRLPDYKMFQYIMWKEGDRDPAWMELLDRLSYQMPPQETHQE